MIALAAAASPEPSKHNRLSRLESRTERHQEPSADQIRQLAAARVAQRQAAAAAELPRLITLPKINIVLSK
jgi:hypothetical protein